MIYTPSELILTYKGAIPALEEVCNVLSSGVLENAKAGSYPTRNPDVYYQVLDYQPAEQKDWSFEFHRQYMDVQVMIRGAEKCYYSPEAADFSLIAEGKDIAFQQAEAREECLLCEGMAVLYFPGELHKPGVKVREGECRKVVFKVKLA